MIKKEKYDPQNLQVHHIESVRMAWTKRFENNNLITLCEKASQRGGRGEDIKRDIADIYKTHPPGVKSLK